MKKIASILIVLSLTALANAQTLTDEYFKKIPALPKDSCNVNRTRVESFIQQTIQSKLSATAQKISNLYAPIESDPEGQKMLKNIDTWKSKLTSMMGAVHSEAGEDYGFVVIADKE